MRGFIGFAAAVCAGFVSSAAVASGEAQPAVTASKVVATPVARTDRTASGQPLKLPSGDIEAVAQIVEIPVGASTTIHRHPWSRFAFVENGPLTVINHDTNETRVFNTGEFLSEVVMQRHEGRALTEPVRLIVIDLVPKGQTNMAGKE